MRTIFRVIVATALVGVLAACGGQTNAGGTFGGSITSVKVKDYPVTCFIAVSFGEVKSIDCLPDSQISGVGN